jgi:hypothetical protein
MLMCLALTACAGLHPIPAPTAVEPEERHITQADGIPAPRQKAWHWDAKRWFTAELDHGCYGPIRFVDQANGIDAYVAMGRVPNMTFASDDPEVVLGILQGYWQQLVFSTDGGRNFVREVRGFPKDMAIEFVVVKQGQVYVGAWPLGRNPDGYFRWERPNIRTRWQKQPPPASTRQLVILQAPLDKAKVRIGRYTLLVPEDYQFTSQYANGVANHIKRVKDIDAFGLPHSAEVAPANACDTTLKLPPWSTVMGKDELLEFYSWYDATKAAYPGWADARSDAFIASHRKSRRGLLDPESKKAEPVKN